MSRVWTSSIEDQFVRAVKSALDTEPDWSDDPLPMPGRILDGEVETAEFPDSSYMSRATYDLKARDLRITLRDGRLLRIAPIAVEYWDELLAAPSKGTFFLNVIGPRFKVERFGWLERVRTQFMSRRRKSSLGFRRFI
jgi:hypothetical protein